MQDRILGGAPEAFEIRLSRSRIALVEPALIVNGRLLNVLDVERTPALRIAIEQL
ncbi:MAG: hypothetical protein V7640_2974, partial [Betaproteobacteria bacterium]